MDLDLYTYQLLTAALFEGTITRDQEHDLLAWLQQDKAHYDLFVSWKNAWIADNHSNEQIETLWYNFQQILNAQVKPVMMPLWRRPMMRWAAVACCAAIFLVFVFHNIHRPTSLTPAATICQVISYTACDQQPSSITLPDGSQAFLNLGSELSWVDNRHVSLVGEAWFEVASDSEHPFVVETKQMTITVTGTQFNVSAYADGQNPMVSLYEGCVRVSTDNQQVLLQSGEQVALSKEGTLQVDACQAELAGLWREGKMDYSAIPMNELLMRLSRMYHTPVVLDEHRNWPQVRFAMYEPHDLQDILLGLAEVYAIHVEKTADGYRID